MGSNKTHDSFDKVIKDLGFRKNLDDSLRFTKTDGRWFYHIQFEGYAYVVYKTINIYVKPLTNLFRIYNKFRKGEASINLYYDVPLNHFREPEKMKAFLELLLEDFDKDEDNI
jgi:hypothetical protein